MSSEMGGELHRELTKQETELAVAMNLRLAMDMKYGDEMLFVECVECIEVTFPRTGGEKTCVEDEVPKHARSRFGKLRALFCKLFSRAEKRKNKTK